MNVVIIPCNNTDNIDKIIKSLALQSVLPDIVIIGIDRCTLEYDSSELPFKLILLNIDYVDIPKLQREDEGFFAGYVRNKCVDYFNDIEIDNFIFIDCDCIPQKDLVKNHVKILSYHSPIISIGKRLELKTMRDIRDTYHNMFQINGKILSDINLLKTCSLLWSCNFALNKYAVNIIKSFNNNYYGKSELFNSDFNGQYGGEDSFLAYVAWILQISFVASSLHTSSVIHIDHDSNRNADHKKFLDLKIEELKKKIMIRPITIFDKFRLL